MIEYLEIVNKIKDVKEEAIEDFNRYVSVPMVLSNLDSIIKQDGDKIIIEKNESVFELELEVRQAFSEIIGLLKKIEKDLYNKIDYKYIDYFEKFKDVNYELDYKEKLEFIELKKITLEILTIFNLKFWCIDDDDRKGFLENLKDFKKEDKTTENDSIEDIEELSSEEFTSDENLEMIKNTWWMNLLNKIRDIKKGLRK